MPEKDIPDKGQDVTALEIEGLRLENEALGQQVKRLIRAESKIYEYQEKLDAQLKEYKDLYELSGKFQKTFDILKIFKYAADYVIHRLEYERVLVFRQVEDSATYTVCSLDGYYNYEERDKAAKVSLDLDDEALAPLLAGSEYLIRKAGDEQRDLAGYGPRFLMDEFLIYPLGYRARPFAFLAVGNSAANAHFYRRVTDSEDALLGVGNLVGLLTPSIENHISYTSIEKAKEELQKAHDELERRVKERTMELSAANKQLRQRHIEASVLYQVSSVISRSIHMDKLLKEVLQTISSLEVFNVDKGGIFVVEDDRMKMIAHIGHSEAFLNLHRDMRVGDCLCGIVAKTGEILISPDSAKDHRHTIVDPETSPHGHLIVPLKTKDRVEGVLDLYMPVEGEIDEAKISLLLSIGNQLGVAIENAKLYEETKALSLHDSLTGLWNHEEIIRLFGRELARAERDGSSVGVIMADLDHFKKINDAYGHMAGDAVLRVTAGRMLLSIRPYDSAGRYGGEEFLVVLPGCDARCTMEIAERLRKKIADEPIETPKRMIPVTVSLGVAVSGRGRGRSVASLIKAADDALYRAKKNGRNRIEVASDSELHRQSPFFPRKIEIK